MYFFILIPVLLLSAFSTGEPVFRSREYRELLRNARSSDSSSSSNSNSAEQIHVPQLSYGHPKLHVHHRNQKHHGHGTDAGHIMASWHNDGGNDKSSKSSSSSSSSESQEGAQVESCACHQVATYFPSPTEPTYPTTAAATTKGNYQWDTYTTGSWYYPGAGKRSFPNSRYITTYSGFRLKGQQGCFCPEMHQVQQAPVVYTTGSTAQST